MDTDGRRENTGRGGEGVTNAMARARIRVEGGLAAVCRRFGGRDDASRPTVAVASEMAGFGKSARGPEDGASWRGWRSVGRRAGQWRSGAVRRGDGSARNLARARLNWASQGQRWGRCKVRRRAERVSRPGGKRTAAAGSWWSPNLLAQTDARRPAIPGYAPSPAPPARRRWRGSGPRSTGG